MSELQYKIMLFSIALVGLITICSLWFFYGINKPMNNNLKVYTKQRYCEIVIDNKQSKRCCIDVYRREV